MVQEEVRSTRYNFATIALQPILILLANPSSFVLPSSLFFSPTRAIKWMIFVSLPIVTVVYFLINIAYFAVLSYDQIRGSKIVGVVSLNIILVCYSNCGMVSKRVGVWCPDFRSDYSVWAP